MAASKTTRPQRYRGSRHFVTCQKSNGQDLCRRPTRTIGVWLYAGQVMPVYECSSGHRFALKDPRDLLRRVTGDARRGELDASPVTLASIVSGESATHQSGSGESSSMPELDLGPKPPGQPRVEWGTDDRIVVPVPRERPVFGS